MAARFAQAEALQVVRELRQEEKRGAVSIVRAADWLARAVIDSSALVCVALGDDWADFLAWPV